ncbi:nucleotidyltransferase domain-containing protein [Paeniglutamicibacter sulfureus]|uniref:cGAS/DncV-like nucleotidyltransferase C-terminal helical domain-containing protein n=1 Tax=Paeniglutamicibacter sulfureus TaxID=43666 RepID=A0ABU2BH60_9MICC|nr:nucleotidyltransferase [Paeniglutamicibacter sulfureus]MDR7357930.1 hypothetical protein [Paeniglutamicibacter sulfureus]
MTALEEKLAGWTGPSSATEQDRQDRTERMIREAINAHPAFQTLSRKVYAKGSYANNTNVRSESDVDVAVECTNIFYYDKTSTDLGTSITPYSGEWGDPQRLRDELIAALRAKFGSDVDTSGSTAIQVHSSSARVEADVVPCFEYRYYYSASSWVEGARVYKTDGTHVENYSSRQLTNGRAKNTRTNQAYKKTVRILKRLENAMVADGSHREAPSFFLECLVYNCPDSLFATSTWTATVKDVLTHIYTSLDGAEPANDNDRWLEVNETKFLFHTSQKWTRKDARDFAYAGWSYLGLGDA